jgi:hypothetical protein
MKMIMMAAGGWLFGWACRAGEWLLEVRWWISWFLKTIMPVSEFAFWVTLMVGNICAMLFIVTMWACVGRSQKKPKA